MNKQWPAAWVGIAVALCAAQASLGQQTGGDAASDELVEPASWLQPPGRQPSLATSQPTARRAATASRLASTSLASVPNMFGDLAGPTSTLLVRDINAPGGITVANTSLTLPAAGGGSRIGKIAENGSPLPRDRVFFSYNHFHNVFQLSEAPIFPPGPAVVRQEPIDRYVIGFEKTFFEEWTSVEIRMPFVGMPDTQLTAIGVNSGNIGNLTAVFKTLLHDDDTLAIGAGVAIETPTGSDLDTRLGSINLRFENQAVHVLPYIGFAWAPGDPEWSWGNGWFFTGFAQVDFNVNGNPVNAFGPGGGAPIATLGQLTDQNLGFLDLGTGYWLYRDPEACRLTGVAVISELHYTTTLQDVDRISGTVGPTLIDLNAIGNRFEVVNGTIGLQFLLFDASSLRVAGVFPLGDEDHRLFDSEVQVQFNRRF